MKGKKSISPLSPTLVKYLHPRVGPKMAEGMTPEEAWRDVIKDVAVASLSNKPLDIFAAAICRLAELDDSGRLQIIDRCLTICPVPEAPSIDKAAQIEELLLEMLVPENTSELRGTTSVEIDSEFLKVMTNVLEHSHKDWSSSREFLQRFFNDCKTKYIPDLEIFYLFPKMPEMARNLIIEPAEAKNLERLFACLQEACAVKGLRLRELIKTKISGRDYEWFDKQASAIFPKGIPSDPEPNKDYIPPTKIDTSLPFTKERHGQLMRSGRLKTQQQLLRPRWHNQQHILLLALRRHPQHMMTRNELIDAALQLDEKWSRETGLPKCFTGLTPRNSASACLTTNADKYFAAIKVDNVTTYYKLSFKPNDLDDAIARYKKWVKQLQEHDWPLCFGRILKSKKGQDLVKHQRIIMLSVGASNPAHLRCRYCGPEKDGCSKELPACARCRAKGQLCIYPLRPDVHKETERQKQKSELNSFLSKKSQSDGRSVNLRAKKVSEEKKVRKNGNGSSYEIELLENIQEGMDLSNVPKKLCDVVDVRPSSIPNAGNGLFAKRNIPMGTPLGFYFGVPMMEDEFDQYKDKVGKASHYSMRYRHTILDATNDAGEPFTDPNGKIHCPFHFMNEDPFGNMVFLEGYEVNQVICLTKRDIRKGEELFVYYGHEGDVVVDAERTVIASIENEYGFVGQKGKGEIMASHES
ncbi:1009_t:CDS:2 [Paraglomus brasilianum]|uniref:1009_t:CDS:1 n=1 Tax=Paraglomus brasilianum TaxID=144538 RepID=A0A9N8YXZ6_9GLOM|nr:1009_t:CDS:2 [Paraglomus brasilianum]